MVGLQLTNISSRVFNTLDTSTSRESRVGLAHFSRILEKSRLNFYTVNYVKLTSFGQVQAKISLTYIILIFEANFDAAIQLNFIGNELGIVIC